MDIIRLIASDLDATLLDGQSRLPPDFAETVRALSERGIRFAAASGRPIYTLEEMFAPLRDDIIFVGDNGGAICWKGESLYLSEMDAADWRTLAGQARSAGHAAVLCGLETAYVEEQFRPYDRVFKRFYTKVEYVPHLEDVTARVDKFTIYFPEGDAQKGYDALYGPVWGGRFSVAVAGLASAGGASGRPARGHDGVRRHLQRRGDAEGGKIRFPCRERLARPPGGGALPHAAQHQLRRDTGPAPRSGPEWPGL